MKFSDITQAIQDFWSFIVPPVLLVSAMAFLCWWIAADASKSLLRKIPYQRVALPNEETRKQLKAFGVTKIAPLLLLILILFSLYTVNNIARAVGRIVPGEIVFRSDLLFLHADKMGLARIWATSPIHAYDFGLLVTEISDQLAALPKESRENVDHWSKEMGSHADLFVVVKFLFLWATGLAIVQLRERGRFRVISRLALTYIALGILGSWYLVQEVNAIEQLGYADMQAAEVKMLSAQREKPDQDSIQKYYDELSKQEAWPRSHGETWWVVESYSGYYWNWLRRMWAQEKRTEKRSPTTPLVSQ